MTLFEEIKQAGIEYDNHESDLYFPWTKASELILAKYRTEKSNATKFLDSKTGTLWFDVPFAYTPWWENRCCGKFGKGE